MSSLSLNISPDDSIFVDSFGMVDVFCTINVYSKILENWYDALYYYVLGASYITRRTETIDQSQIILLIVYSSRNVLLVEKD
jgi:hypothetical protein